MLVFTTCRKYPENRLWFANPKNYYPIGKYITELRVNGVDSMDALNNYYVQNYSSSNPSIPNNVRDLVFTCLRDGVEGYFYIEGEQRFSNLNRYVWSEGYKEIYFGLRMDTLTNFERLLFVSKNSTWKVMYFGKDGTRKYKRDFNGNIYEITFKENK